MVVLILLTVLAAFGGLCALWVLFGFLLSHGHGAAAVCLCREDTPLEPMIRRYRWLCNTGLIRCPFYFVDCGLTPQQQKHLLEHQQGVILCTPEDLMKTLQQEAGHLD